MSYGRWRLLQAFNFKPFSSSTAAAAPENRIVGGDHVTIQEFPYIVAYTYRYPGPGITVQRCVGALVSSWHVVTSGFCFT